VAVGQRFTAREPGDPLNTMSYQDGVIAPGITSAGGSRWEDWSNIAQDPTDDCTFWYFGGYGDSSRTGGPYFGKVGAFRVPTCRLDATGAAPRSITGAFSGSVATFTDSDLTAGAGDFSARIDWGDGSSSDGAVTGGHGGFDVAGSHTYAAKGRYAVTVSITGTDRSVASAQTRLDDLSTEAGGQVSGTVPATLALSLGTPASFGAFTPGAAHDYSAATTADVVSSAGDAALTVSDPSAIATGHLVNGAFSLPQPLQASAASPAGHPAGGPAPVGGSAAPTPLLAWAAPVSHDPVAVTFKQSIAADDALRTGTYSKTLTFTLSTTTP
jgi:hypothetical protein